MTAINYQSLFSSALETYLDFLGFQSQYKLFILCLIKVGLMVLLDVDMMPDPIKQNWQLRDSLRCLIMKYVMVYSSCIVEGIIPLN